MSERLQIQIVHLCIYDKYVINSDQQVLPVSSHPALDVLSVREVLILDALCMWDTLDHPVGSPLGGISSLHSLQQLPQWNDKSVYYCKSHVNMSTELIVQKVWLTTCLFCYTRESDLDWIHSPINAHVADIEPCSYNKEQSFNS